MEGAGGWEAGSNGGGKRGVTGTGCLRETGRREGGR